MSRPTRSPYVAHPNGRLDDREYRTRVNEPKVPDDHPVAGSPTKPSDNILVREYIKLIDYSGVLPILRRRLKVHLGYESRLPIRALLVAILYVGGEIMSYKRNDLCAFFAGLDPQIAVDLAIHTTDTAPVPIPYNVTHKQITRLEGALKSGWRDDETDQWCDANWLSLALLKASIPREIARKITAVAVDGTDYPTFALCRVFDRKNDKLTGPVVDLEAEAKRAVKEREKTGQPEPEDPYEFEEPPNEPPEGLPVSSDDVLGSIGSDGRDVRGKDTDARVGRHSATNSRPAGYYFGYEMTPVVAIKPFLWRGDPDACEFGEDIDGYVLAMGIAPAGANPGPVGYDTVQRARQVAPGIDEVVADRGFTTKRLTFNRPLHQDNIHLLMDYKDQVIANPTAVVLGNRGDAAIMHAGTVLHSFTETNWQVPDEVFIKATAAQLKQSDIDAGVELVSEAKYAERATQKWYGQRAKLFAYTVHEHKKNGRKRIICPVHTGKIAIPATSRDANNIRAPLITVPKGHKGMCCPGAVTVEAEELDMFQHIPYGTRAWCAAYGRRSNVERIIGILKSNGGLAKDNCRAFGIVPHHLAATAVAVAYNLRLTRAAKERDDHNAAEIDDPNPKDITPPSTPDNLNDLDNNDSSPDQHSAQTGPQTPPDNSHQDRGQHAPTGVPPPT